MQGRAEGLPEGLFAGKHRIFATEAGLSPMGVRGRERASAGDAALPGEQRAGMVKDGADSSSSSLQTGWGKCLG